MSVIDWILIGLGIVAVGVILWVEIAKFNKNKKEKEQAKEQQNDEDDD